MGGWSLRTFLNAQYLFGKLWLRYFQTRIAANCYVPRETWFSLFKDKRLQRTPTFVRNQDT